MAIDEADKQKLTGQQIHDQAPAGWGKVLNKLIARFETGDFNTGAALVTKIAEAADEMDHHPDVDLRYPHLTVSLRSHDVDAITPRDLRLAATITALAADAGVRPAEHAPDVLELALDTPDRPRDLPFWSAILGYTDGTAGNVNADEDAVEDPAARNVSLWFQDTDSDAPDRQRWHLDISVPREVAEDRIQAAIDAGGRLVSDERAPAFWVLADPGGNLVCICTWESRD
jgi:4a-hydroxytetrahydrobiopterin dehydratase